LPISRTDTAHLCNIAGTRGRSREDPLELPVLKLKVLDRMSEALITSTPTAGTAVSVDRGQPTAHPETMSADIGASMTAPMELNRVVTAITIVDGDPKDKLVRRVLVPTNWKTVEWIAKIICGWIARVNSAVAVTTMVVSVRAEIAKGIATKAAITTEGIVKAVVVKAVAIAVKNIVMVASARAVPVSRDYSRIRSNRTVSITIKNSGMVIARWSDPAVPRSSTTSVLAARVCCYLLLAVASVEDHVAVINSRGAW
jgi:hypothetical protein